MTKHTLLIEDVDTTGALRDAAEKVAGSQTRAGFLAKGALATGGAVVGGGLLTAHASAATASGDVHILNFALLLEYLESSFYADAQARGLVQSDAAKLFASTAGAHEATHVQFLQKALGSKAIAEPTFDFSSKVTDEPSFYATSMTLEDTGVSAYKGQAPLLKSKTILQQALYIHSIEARHAAWVRYIAGNSPVIAPADKPKTEQQVTAAVQATGFITSPIPSF